MTERQEKASFFERIRLDNKPIAHPESVVTVGSARFTILTPRLIRLEWSGQPGQFEDHATFAFPTRYSDTPPVFRRHDQEGQLTLDTGYLILRYDTNSTESFSPANLSIEFQLGGELIMWSPGLANPYNLRGTRRTLDECAGDAALEEGILSRAGWTLFDDSRSFLFGEDGWVIPRPDHDYQDWYFFGYGHDYKAALGEYSRFGGAIPLIPRFVLGSWWSRYWAYSDRDLMKLAEDFTDHDLPLDVLVLDMDWHTEDSWTGYTWNRKLFPDPPAFLNWLHDRKLRTTLNLHPAEGVQPFEEIYPEFARRMGLDPTQPQTIPFRITDKTYVQHYFELLHHPLEDIGVDFWWMDWQQGRSSELAGLDPLPWLNHLHFLDSTRRGSRAMLYSRWGGLGNHRYHIGFSGDTIATWEALQFQPYFTATASNVGYGWWSHDIGGHFGPSEPELFARWVQFGALNPCLRLHSTKDPLAERRPWAFSKEVFQASRAAFHLRYQLVPYLYTLARQAADSAVSICRPMYYEHPTEEAAYAARYQYYLGDDMIAAPIVQPADPITNLASTDVWLPGGDWYDFFTLESYSGPGWKRILGDLQRIPLLVRAGSVVPLAPLADTTDALPHDRLILKLFPGQAGAFRLYEDDGTTEAYHRGEFEWTPIHHRIDSDDIWEVEIGAVEGHCPGLPTRRAYELHFSGTFQPAEALVNDQLNDNWRYDADSQTVILNIGPQPKNSPVRVRLLSSGTEASLVKPLDANNLTLRDTEVKRVLGAHTPSVRWNEMTEAVLQLDVPGKADAIARLGGPFVRFVEYTTPEEAAHHLGLAIVGGPAEGMCEVEVTWQFWPNQALPPHTATVGSQGGLFYAPFALTEPTQAHYWTAQVKIQWRGQTLTYTHQSKPIFAAIPRWQVTVYNEDTPPITPEAALADLAQATPRLAWETYQPDETEIKNISDPFYVRLRERYTPRIRAGESLVSYALATIVSPDEREVVLQFRVGGPLQMWLNGQALEPLAAQEQTVPQRVIHPRLNPGATGVVKLKAGKNQLLVETRPPHPIPFWWFSVIVVRPEDGSIMTDLDYEQIG